MSTRGNGFIFRNRPRQARFCPWCGVQSLMRDEYRKEHGVSQVCAEFWCLTCGVGFDLRNSYRAIQAQTILREQAKLRPGKN